MTDPYATLGVSPTATAEEITRAYRRRLRSYHPDLRDDPTGPGADEQLRAVLAAYALLRDPGRRAEYDRSVSAGGGDERPARPRTFRPVSAAVYPIDTEDDPPPLWAGPVRWHRNG